LKSFWYLQRRFLYYFVPSCLPKALRSSITAFSCNATMAVIDEMPQQAADPQPIDIQAWTEQATAALGVTIAAPGEVTGATTVTLAIPLDEHDVTSGGPVQPVGASAAAQSGGHYKRKEPLRRDSMNRREALLKGKEGSRQRRRWENGQPPPPLAVLVCAVVDVCEQIVF
jgi:hypothetical protein